MQKKIRVSTIFLTSVVFLSLVTPSCMSIRNKIKLHQAKLQQTEKKLFTPMTWEKKIISIPRNFDFNLKIVETPSSAVALFANLPFYGDYLAYQVCPAGSLSRCQMGKVTALKPHWQYNLPKGYYKFHYQFCMYTPAKQPTCSRQLKVRYHKQKNQSSHKPKTMEKKDDRKKKITTQLIQLQVLLKKYLNASLQSEKIETLVTHILQYKILALRDFLQGINFPLYVMNFRRILSDENDSSRDGYALLSLGSMPIMIHLSQRYHLHLQEYWQWDERSAKNILSHIIAQKFPDDIWQNYAVEIGNEAYHTFARSLEEREKDDSQFQDFMLAMAKIENQLLVLLDPL